MSKKANNMLYNKFLSFLILTQNPFCFFVTVMHLVKHVKPCQVVNVKTAGKILVAKRKSH